MKTLATTLLSGSIGIWGDEQMPANPELSENEVIQAVEYILKQGGNKNSHIYTGYEGAIRPFEHASGDTTCVYVLTTFYTDKGKDSIPGPQLRGQHSILLK